MVALVGSGIAFCICLLVSLVTLCCVKTNENNIEYCPVETVDILCLEDNKSVNGPHYLLSSSVEENLYYYYMYDEPSLGKTVDKIPAGNSYIKYADEDFRIETLDVRCENRFVGFWLGADLGLEDIYIVYIPENSITVENSYNIDLK